MEKNELFSNGYALLIGVGNYPDVTPLPTTVNDATVLYKILTDPSRAGYPAGQVRLLVNNEATKQGIIDGLDWLKDCADKNPLATVIVYFSGHGGSKHDQFLLLPFDFKNSDWKNSAILNTTFIEKIDAIHPKKMVVVLDCCHAAGIITKSGTEVDFKPSNLVLHHQLQKGHGNVIASSCGKHQHSHIFPDAQYSVFTDALIDALDYHGRREGENYVTILNTLAYVSKKVKMQLGAKQTPVYNMHDTDDFYICRINTEFASKHPFKKTAAYTMGAYVQQDTWEAASGIVSEFKAKQIKLLDDKGFNAVPEVLKNISESGFDYDKPGFANLRNYGLSKLAALVPDDYIVSLKIFIGTIS